MREKIVEWLSREANWYHFWLPQSGLAGGTICGAITMVCIKIVMLAVRG